MAKSVSPATKTKVTAAHPTRNSLRDRAARKRRDQNLLLIGGAALFVLLIGFVVYQSIRSEQPVAGEETLTSQGNSHIEFGSPSPLAYNSTPPTSGPHYGNLVGWNIYGPDEPQRYEHLVHNLEDAGVVIYYQCPDNCPDLLKQLTDIADPYIKAGRHVAVVPNNPKWTVGNSQPLHQDMGARIALTAWTKILKMDQVDAAKIRKFIDRYEGIDHHVSGQG
jgi:hypothetical protein